MIRYYCQYSYGGFKAYRINGEAHELLSQLVSSENKYGFPDLAELYFNQGGVKILYRYLDNNTIALIIKEIPSNGLDSDNRPISCAIQFIGDVEDRQILDKLAISIANDINKFEVEFANMFDLRGGLHFEGDQLNAIVEECKKSFEYVGNPILQDIVVRSGTILLLVPFSDNYGVDKAVTKKIIAQLQLPEQEARDKKRYIRLSDLMAIQHGVSIVDSMKRNNTEFPEGAMVTNGQEIHNDFAGENFHLKSENKKLLNEVYKLKAERNRFKKKCYCRRLFFSISAFTAHIITNKVIHNLKNNDRNRTTTSTRV